MSPSADSRIPGPDTDARLPAVREANRSPTAATPVRDPAMPGTDRRTPSGRILHGLQRSAGNRAVSHLLGRAPSVQRVPVAVTGREETLFNQHPGGLAPAKPEVYGGSGPITFDMARDGVPEAVTCTVKIRFVNQARDRQGHNSGSASVIPVGDPRRAFGQNIVDTAPAVWNGRAKLVGKHLAVSTSPTAGTAPVPDTGPITLPLVFKAVAVWDLTTPVDSTVNLFGPSVVAGSAGNPIDSGDYYMNRGKYAGMTDLQIYAHEYGHLIGLPDEYSQDNPEMHALLHGMDPATSAARAKVLDKETVRVAVMATLTRPLFDRLMGAKAEIVNAFRKGSDAVRKSLAGELTALMGDSSMQSVFELGLPPANAALSAGIPAAVAAAATAAKNTTGLAAKVIKSEFAPGVLGGWIHDAYWTALGSTQDMVDVGGGLKVNINVEGRSGIMPDGMANVPPSGLYAFASDGPAAKNAAKIASNVVGKAQTGKTPPIRPSASLIGQLDALPAAWSAFSSGAPAAFSSATMKNDMTTSIMTAWFARLMGSSPALPAVTTAKALAKAIDGSIHQAAIAASSNGIRDFLNGQIQPVMDASVAGLMTAVGTEVDTIMATPAGTVAAAAPADPNIAAIAGKLHKKLDAQTKAAEAAQTRAGTTPLDPGKTAPAQSVTYDTHNMMSDNTQVFRVDQFTAIADEFNGASRLRKADEDFFHAEKV